MHRDGREFLVELTITPIRFAETHIFSAFLRDITERKRMDAEINDHSIQLEAANKELEAFSTPSRTTCGRRYGVLTASARRYSKTTPINSTLRAKIFCTECGPPPSTWGNSLTISSTSHA